jgi:hypothetical protein
MSRGDKGGDYVSEGAGPLALCLPLCWQEWGRDLIPLFCLVVMISLPWCAIGVVGVAPGRINLPQFHCHTGSILHGSILKLMETRACWSFGLTSSRFVGGIGEAATTTPLVSSCSVLLLRSCLNCLGGAGWICKHGRLSVDNRCGMISWLCRREATYTAH